MRRKLAALVCLSAFLTCTEDRNLTSPRGGRPAAALTGGDPVFVGAGDIAECDRHSYDTDTLLQGIPGTVWTAGDNAYPDASDSDYTTCYAPTWGLEKARTYPALGNHEFNLGNANAYWNYFGTTSFGFPNGYYSYDLGSWHIIVLQSTTPFASTDFGGAQEQWLKADLAAHPSYCTLAIWHHSRFFSPISTDSPDGDASMVKPFWVDLYNAGADVVLGGHEHHYERFAPQDPNGVADPQAGIREFVVGTGGAGLGGNFTSTRQNSEARSGTTWGVLKLTLHASSYDWKFIPVKGQTFADSGTGSCHGAKPVVSAGYSQLVNPGGTVSLNATFSDFDGSSSSPWNYTIAWGDGASSSGTVTTVAALDTIQASHVYSTLGQYVLSVTVTDATGLSGSSNSNVNVTTDNVLVGGGNIARCDSPANGYATAAVLDSIGGIVFTAGDNPYASGSLTEFQNCYGPTWGRDLPRTRPTPGDKDYQTAGASGYFSYFGAAAGDPTKGYYSYDLGAWHVIALNSSISTSTGSAQEQWLKADLAATTKSCILAYWHYPLFASTTGTQGWGPVKPLWVDLYGARADVVIGAHYQFYERFALQTPGGVADSLGGIREFVAGTGGQSWGSTGTPLPTSQVLKTQTWGVLKLTLHATSYDWKFFPIAGQTFTDSGSTACHTKGPVSSVVVTPTSATVSVGNTTPLSATTLDASGNALTDRVVTWATSNSGVATVSASGVVTGVATGSATITATSEGKSATAAISVVAAVASVAVSPASANVAVGGTQQLTATPHDANGNPLTGRSVTWATSAAAVATVSANGVVTGVATGSATITATSEGQSGTAAITVLTPAASVSVTPSSATVSSGNTVQLTATTLDANGNPITGWPVAWASGNTAVATASASGLVTGAGGGSATITATSGGQSGTSAITVTTVPVASVVVSPASANVAVGGTQQLTATTLDANGSPLTGRTITWASNATAVATVSGSGLVSGVAAGSATITATSEGKSGTSAITVNPAPVASVTVAPASATVAVGGAQQLTATTLDANGNPLTGRTITWTTNASAVATVDANGLVTGVAAGSATITATSEGKSGSSAITVLTPVASVSVSPASATVSVGSTVQLSATALDGNGAPVAGWPVSWASGNPAVATVSASGFVTAVGGGSVTITATSGGKSGTSAITVPVPVASVTVSPASATVAVGSTVQLTATPRDAGGNPLTGRTITWASSAVGVATVDANGLVTAVGPGSATITASSEGKSGTSTITVPVPVASVAVSPTSATVLVSNTVQLTATPLDANGNPLTGRTITWASNNTAVATVSGNGLVTGVATGSATITATSEGKSGTSAITVPTTLPPVTLVGAGNITRCDQTHDDSTAALVSGIAGTVFTSGSNVYSSGSLTDFTNCYGPSWGQLLARTRPAVGVKDYQTPGAAGYWQYFHGAVAVGDSGNYYYSYDLGAWHVIVLNSEISTAAGSPQEQWLKADLAATTKRCQVAIWGAPRFSSAGTQIRSSVLPLWQDLYAAGAELVLNSHYRVYERFAPQTPSGVLDTLAGIRQITIGTGGITPDTFNVALAPNSQVRATKLYGVLQLTLSDGSYTWQFKQVPGEQPAFTDGGTTACH